MSAGSLFWLKLTVTALWSNFTEIPEPRFYCRNTKYFIFEKCVRQLSKMCKTTVTISPGEGHPHTSLAPRGTQHTCEGTGRAGGGAKFSHRACLDPQSDQTDPTRPAPPPHSPLGLPTGPIPEDRAPSKLSASCEFRKQLRRILTKRGGCEEKKYSPSLSKGTQKTEKNRLETKRKKNQRDFGKGDIMRLYCGTEIHG